MPVATRGRKILAADQRFIDDAVTFLQNQVANPPSQPFCLVVSLVNPHDVLGYPNSYASGGYEIAKGLRLGLGFSEKSQGHDYLDPTFGATPTSALPTLSLSSVFRMSAKACAASDQRQRQRPELLSGLKRRGDDARRNHAS